MNQYYVIPIAVLGLAAAVLAILAILRKWRPPAVGGAGEYGNVFAGEAGGFLFVRLDTADGGATLVKATFDFTACGLKANLNSIGVPTVNNGVASFQPFTTGNVPIFGFTATGFNPGDDLLVQAPRLEKADGMPAVTGDLYSGRLTIDLSDGRQKIGRFSLPGRNSMAAIATF